MTNTETVSAERPDGHYWVRFGVGHEWEVMLWDGTHFWGTAGDGYRGEDFEVGPQVFPPTSSRGNHPQSPVLQGFEDENGLEGNRLSASRTQSPAEWQVEAAYDAFVAACEWSDWDEPEVRGYIREALRAASIPAPERSKEETGKALPDDDNALAQMVEDFHVGSVAFADDPDEFCHLIEFTPELLRAFVAALETPPLHKEEEDHGRYLSRDDYCATDEGHPLDADYAAPVPVPVTITNGWPDGPFQFGDRVEKTKGSSWHGRVCGWYRTDLTPLGYNVESEREPGSVQLYPAAALSKPGEQ